jgi:S-adenosylmethionine:tRNA ribosyltransferase-isomerase
MAGYTLSDFDYRLPPELIAQVPAVERTGSRLLHVDGGALTDHTFTDLPQLIARGDLVVFNDTRVVKARLHAVRPTGGKVELLLERALGADEGIFQLRASHPPKPGGELLLPDGAVAVEGYGRYVKLDMVTLGGFDPVGEEWYVRPD